MFRLDSTKVPNGTVLMMGVRYDWASRQPEEDLDATRGRTSPKVYTYALLKAGGLWYVTGSGKVPTAAGWGAVTRWLERDGRVVEWVKAAGVWVDLYPEPPQVHVDEPSYYDLPHR